MSPLGEAMAVVLLVGAARADADAIQTARLREHLPAAVRGQSTPVLDKDQAAGVLAVRDDVHALLLDVMGAGWCPSGSWATWLGALGVEWPPASSPGGDVA